jgi:hypothetical protein
VFACLSHDKPRPTAKPATIAAVKIVFVVAPGPVSGIWAAGSLLSVLLVSPNQLLLLLSRSQRMVRMHLQERQQRALTQTGKKMYTCAATATGGLISPGDCAATSPSLKQ